MRPDHIVWLGCHGGCFSSQDSCFEGQGLKWRMLLQGSIHAEQACLMEWTLGVCCEAQMS